MHKTLLEKEPNVLPSTTWILPTTQIPQANIQKGYDHDKIPLNKQLPHKV
uniref:Uncharacterized protein n=1 Tax=Rhizophora mucronata TaxID=61149 RepID=A0A2P2QMX5_RHIMU